MSTSATPCEICKISPATLFMQVTDATHSAQAHVCTDCFHIAKDITEGTATVEEISQQDFNPKPT